MNKRANYETFASLDEVKQVINEANRALHTPTSTIKGSPINKALAGAIGGGAGAGIGIGAAGLAGGGAGLAGGAAAGVPAFGFAAGAAGLGAGAIAAIVAIPVVVIGGGAFFWAKWRNKKRLIQEKVRLLQEAIRKRDAIIEELSNDVQKAKAHIEHLVAINTLLQKTIGGLTEDLQAVAS